MARTERQFPPTMPVARFGTAEDNMLRYLMSEAVGAQKSRIYISPGLHGKLANNIKQANSPLRALKLNILIDPALADDRWSME